MTNVNLVTPLKKFNKDKANRRKCIENSCTRIRVEVSGLIINFHRVCESYKNISSFY